MYSAGSTEAVAQSGFIRSGKRENSKEISLSARSSQTGSRAWCLVVGTLRSDGVPSRSHGYQSYSPKRAAPNKTLKMPSNSRVQSSLDTLDTLDTQSGNFSINAL